DLTIAATETVGAPGAMSGRSGDATSTVPIIPALSCRRGLGIVTSTLKTRLWASAEGETAVTRPGNPTPTYASLVTVNCLPTWTRCTTWSGTPNTALTCV